MYKMAKNTLTRIALLSSFSILFFGCSTKSEKELSPSLMLWYNQPAKNWNEALPIGNGRLGAMIYGGIEKETIQFNEETLWTGQPHDYSNKGAHEYVDQLRQLLWDGKQKEAHELGNAKFMSQPLRQASYQAFGNILLDFPDHKKAINYQRKLDLEDAISSVSYDVEGVTFTREVFASQPNQAIITQIKY